MQRSGPLWVAGIVFAGFSLFGLFGGPTAAPASAVSPSNNDTNNYLALGDSVSFGYNPLLVEPGVDPDVFVGFPQLASDLFRPQKTLANASCPGETSTSLITGTRPDNGCQNYREFIGPLHVSYSGSQLAFAESYLASNPGTGLVTIMIGANDLLLLSDGCGGVTNVSCIEAGLPGLLETLSSNLTTIYSGLETAGFNGELVAVTYYSLDYADAAETGIIEELNATIAKVTQEFGGRVADGFGEFQQAAAAFGGDSCAAGLLIHLTSTTCDIHPSQAGAALLADAVLQATQITSMTTTEVHNGANGAPWANTNTTGSSALDTATVTGGSGSLAPTGTVTFTFFTNGSCSGPGTTSPATTLMGGSADSTPTGPLAAGSYSFLAMYSGDPNNTGSMSDCEPFSVAAVTPTPPPTTPGTTPPTQEATHPSQIVTDLGRPTPKTGAGSLVWPLGGGLAALFGIAGVAAAVRRLRSTR